MIFLIEYDRREGRLATFKTFDSSERPRAQRERLELELRLNRAGLQREVVLLEAKNEAMLRRTHRRYFASSEELISSIAAYASSVR